MRSGYVYYAGDGKERQVRKASRDVTTTTAIRYVFEGAGAGRYPSFRRAAPSVSGFVGVCGLDAGLCCLGKATKTIDGKYGVGEV